MLDRAAMIWDVDRDSLEMEKGVLSSKTDPELNMTFKELCAQMEATGGPIMGSGTVDPKGEGGSFAGNVVDVEVDPETGKVTILRFTAVQDAGKAIHPSYVEGQMQGGSVQGIGWALNEEYFMDDAGRMTNTSLLDYRMPVALDPADDRHGHRRGRQSWSPVRGEGSWRGQHRAAARRGCGRHPRGHRRAHEQAADESGSGQQGCSGAGAVGLWQRSSSHR